MNDEQPDDAPERPALTITEARARLAELLARTADVERIPSDDLTEFFVQTGGRGRLTEPNA